MKKAGSTLPDLLQHGVAQGGQKIVSPRLTLLQCEEGSELAAIGVPKDFEESWDFISLIIEMEYTSQSRKRQTIELIPVTEVHYQYAGKMYLYYVYGMENKVYALDYPESFYNYYNCTSLELSLEDSMCEKRHRRRKPTKRQEVETTLEGYSFGMKYANELNG
uniref:Uncharacterized protein n=1 Tax=Sphaerodactylus townsendi TaxID=933632 RepID=A0ACB8EH90_9SAUR